MEDSSRNIDLERFFLQDKPVNLLLEIKRRSGENYASVLSREVECTYSHTVKVLDTFQDVGLIDFKEDGRKKLIELTRHGREIAESMEDLVQKLDGETQK
ncbi:MAG: MarR family winged helix-turn-helix transcriptional regulator [Candidatus Nanohaloarchaea archaeon]|nr:MarR family winged helix-turn-helix transcriptional regulator [Candidatus Nanohaloarchaea archaeon]